MSVPAAATKKIVAQNRKARHEFHIEEVFEAGLVLTGTEVKSLRLGKGSIVEAYVQAAGGELWLTGCHIPPYEQGNIHNVDPVRRRKLLLHKREIEKLAGAVSRKGYTIVPLQIYFKNGRAKIEIGLAKGKKLYDKRQDIKERDQKRDIDRAIRSERR
jgi:SsrA-binding protein